MFRKKKEQLFQVGDRVINKLSGSHGVIEGVIEEDSEFHYLVDYDKYITAWVNEFALKKESYD